MNVDNRLELLLTLNAEAFKRGLSSVGTAVRTMAGGAVDAFKSLTGTGNAIDKVGSSANSAKGKIREAANEVGNLGAKSKTTSAALEGLVGRYLKVAAIAGAVVFSGKSAMDFESAMADVSKVVDGTADQIDGLRKSIIGMTREIPLSATQLAAIAAEAGSLGIAVGDIEEFTRTVAKMSTAFNMTAEEAGNAIGKIKNIFGLSLSEMTVFGDTVNQLGNTTAAKEKEIVDSMMRIGGSSKQFGLSTKEAAALSAAFISLGKTPETASTAINSLLAKLQTAESQGKSFQEGLAQMGVSASDLAADIKKGPNEAIVKFLETLKGLDNEDRAKALVNLFGTEFQDDIGTLVTGLDSYKLALKNVADASSYAGGMQKEFETRSKTTANQLILTKSAVNEIAINIGSFFLPTVNRALKSIADFTTKTIDFVAARPAFSAALTSIGEGLKQLFSDISQSWAGDLIARGARAIMSALEELSAMLDSGELAGKLKALSSQWSVWADDVATSIKFVGQLFGNEMDAMQLQGSGVVSFLVDAFRNFPANVRAFIGLITVMAAAEFDKTMVRTQAFKDMVAALFNDKTVDQVAAERDRQLRIINEARDQTIDSILKERNAAIESTNAQIEAAKKLRKEFEKKRQALEKSEEEAKDKDGEAKEGAGKEKAENEPEETKSDKPTQPKKPKFINVNGTWELDSSGDDAGQASSAEDERKRKQRAEYQKQLAEKRKQLTPEKFAERQQYWKTLEEERPLTKEEEKQRKAEEAKFRKDEAERKRLEKEEETAAKRAAQEEERAELERLKRLKQEEIQTRKEIAAQERLAKEGAAEEQKKEKPVEADRRNEDEDEEADMTTASSASPMMTDDQWQESLDNAEAYEEQMRQAHEATAEAAKEAAEKWSEAQEQAAEKSKSAFQRYADKVRSLQDEIAGRERSLAEELDELDTRGTAESKWRRMAKEAKDYEKAAREAQKAGDLEQALSLSDRAKQLYAGLKGGAGDISDKMGDQAALRGVKSAGLLGIDIAKAIQQATAKTALTAMPGGNLFGDLSARIRGQLAAVAGGGSEQPAGRSATQVSRVVELRFPGGAIQAPEDAADKLLDLFAQAGMSAG